MLLGRAPRAHKGYVHQVDMECPQALRKTNKIKQKCSSVKGQIRITCLLVKGTEKNTATPE